MFSPLAARQAVSQSNFWSTVKGDGTVRSTWCLIFNQWNNVVGPDSDGHRSPQGLSILTRVPKHPQPPPPTAQQASHATRSTSAWLPGTTMAESRREALAAAPMSTTASTVGANATDISGTGSSEDFSKLKDKFMNELNKIPRESCLWLVSPNLPGDRVVIG
ncbi:hypothetical protein J4Q44_G00142550 [Coregonus suidteri]|uniref:Uncharacterized protein n=1 Tax=Coregonus suidteri TaxID=861788 RepID=A0AAN8M142_9TELE